jgi:hypothetical protein
VSLSRAAVDYGYEVEYTRVPVTDEKAPKEKDFALLMRRLWKPPEGAALIFNCQMGRGRTSTGMIIASLLQLRRRLKTVDLPTEPQGDVPTAQHLSSTSAEPLYTYTEAFSTDTYEAALQQHMNMSHVALLLHQADLAWLLDVACSARLTAVLAVSETSFAQAMNK